MLSSRGCYLRGHPETHELRKTLRLASRTQARELGGSQSRRALSPIIRASRDRKSNLERRCHGWDGGCRQRLEIKVGPCCARQRGEHGQRVLDRILDKGPRSLAPNRGWFCPSCESRRMHAWRQDGNLAAGWTRGGGHRAEPRRAGRWRDGNVPSPGALIRRKKVWGL